MICGIDEAGRGPIIGPLVIAAACIEESNLKKLESLGVKDSKLLTPKKREELFKKLKSVLKEYKIIKILPSEIDNAVESKTDNLNWLEARKAVQLINDLNPTRAIIDCPSNNKQAYATYLQKLLKTKTILKVEHKADLNYPIVGAASILAKVTRDKEIEAIKKRLGDIGSGYPSDQITQKFLRENWQKHQKIFRHSWEPYKRYSRRLTQKTLMEACSKN